TAILIGHIAAVYLAHLKAMQVLDTRRIALRSQVPLTALMVIYTFVSLSILAESIVERRAPAQPIAAEIDVPEDALLPESGSGRLQPVGAGKIAKQRLTYRVLGSAFHDGTRMGAADVLYSYAFAYRWGARGNGADSHRDPWLASATAVLRAHLRGVRVAATDTTSKSFRFGDFDYVRELLVIDVYPSVPPVDPEQDAVIAPPWSTLPWHLLVLMEEAVDRGWAAFSQSEARRRGVDWLDLVRSDATKERLAGLLESFEREGYRPGPPKIAVSPGGADGLDLVRSDATKERLAGLLESFEREGYRPDPLKSLVSAEDARKRWAALKAFYKERGHLLVTNGPYRLKSWSADSVTLEAF